MYQKTLYRATSRTPPPPCCASGPSADSEALEPRLEAPIVQFAIGLLAHQRGGTLSRAHAQAQHAQPSRVVDCRACLPVCLPACLIPPTPQALGPWVLIYRKLEGARIRRTPLDRVQKCQKKFLERKESEEKKNCVCMCTCECACVFVCVDGGKDVCVRVRV